VRSGGNVILAALGILLAFALVAGEGRFFWIGAAAVIAAGCVIVASLLGALPRPALTPAGLACVGLFAAFALWSGASILWSAAPDRSWEFFNQMLVYLGFLALGLFVTRSARYADLLAGLLGGLIALALGMKVFALDDGRRARLNEPIGYWNTLGLLTACAVPLALRLRSRLLSVLLLYGAVVVMLLTQSRGGLLLAILAAGAWLAFERGGRYEPALRLAASVPLGVAVGAFGLAFDGIAKDGRPHSDRLSAGLWLGLAVAVGALLVVALARLDLAPAKRPAALRTAAYVVLPVVAAALLFVGIRAALDFSEPVTPENPIRIAEGSGNNRAQWWKEAAHGIADNPVVGNGAAAFQVTHRRYRQSNVEVREPHSLPLQFLSETGVLGFALFAGAIVAAGFAVRRDRALLLVLGVFAIGVLYDIHWDFTAAGAVAFATLGVLLPRGARAGGRDALWAAGAAAIALAGTYSLAAPWLADRRIDDAFAAIEQGDLASAVDAAEEARALNPTSVEPLFALGFVQDALGQTVRARDYYADAVQVQPENREGWYLLGRLEYDDERYADAYGRFNRMYALDPHGPHVEWVERARCKLNPTGC
jgi:O-antigen ligase